MSSGTVRRVHTAPTCPDCGKHFVYTADNPYTEELNRMPFERDTEQEIRSFAPTPEIEGVPTEFVVPRYSMTSAYSKAAEVTYRLVKGESGRAWLIPDPEVPDMGSRIYVTASEDWSKKGEGFGGATIPMKLSTGGFFDLKGGWHTNASGLYEDTGVDLRKRHVTFVVISRGIDYNQSRTDPHSGRVYPATVMTNIVYIDPPGGIEGYFMRGKHLCVELMQKSGEAYFLYSASSGGSSLGRMKPDEGVRDPEDLW